MAIDTAAKRASSAQMLNWAVLAPPFPDGALTADRAHILHLYAGIAATAPAGVLNLPIAYAADIAAYGAALADATAYGFVTADQAQYGAGRADRATYGRLVLDVAGYGDSDDDDPGGGP